MRHREVRLRRTPLRVTCTAWLLALLIPVGAVSNLAAQVPAPEDVFGFPVGADHRLADYDQILSYFEALDAASERVALERIGTSTLGRPMLLALISSEANLASRKRYRQIAARLARADGLGEAKARALAREGRAVVWIDGGLHATEVAHGQHTSELAWWLATDEGDEARRIRENTILLLMPVMNPDGLDIVVDWYRGNVGTRYETAPLPELVGGIGGEGVAALRRYVDGGGWLLAIDEAATFAIDQLGLPVRNVVAGLEPSDFFVPGSLIRIDIDPSDPLGHGMPSDAMAFFVRSQVLETTTPEAGSTAGVPVSYVRYAPSDALASGWAQGADRHLLGRSAAVRVPYGGGQVVLLGFRPHFRGQPHNTYKLLFNPLHASTLDDDAWSGSIPSRSF